MPDKRFSKRRSRLPVGPRIADAILDYVGQTPRSSERPQARPESRARAIAGTVARHAALTTGGLSLPPGPLGWLTLLPELRSLWELQTQMVADIAACYGKTHELTREEMIYCLFRHTDAQAVRDLVTQIGKRFVVQRASRPQVQAVVLKIAMHIGQRVIGKGIARWIPVVGALGAGAYAYYDTTQVADTAIEFFGGVVDVQAADAEWLRDDDDEAPHKSR
ncbi:EcsC family protein [Candidatus Accumulibacter sp. ACC003]|uniref:EcsC family protein n=1 Tax=Candidatus Accumulibacter sp. ACC003 TaxID=2823334 RepID=UPI0025C29D94|nr:EcsC family protein [Candidatus Accumulibacter sp. ACC003]